MKKRGRLKASVEMFKEAAEIGDRLRQMRENADLSQSRAADELGISRERLANYEDGRTPLKTFVGLLACRQFIYSEKWLATGKGDPRMFVNLTDYPASQVIDPDAFYGTVFREILAAQYEEIAARNPFDLPLPSLGLDPTVDARVLREFIFEWHALLRDGSGRIGVLMSELIWFGMEYCAKNLSRDRLSDPDLLVLDDVRDSVAFVGEKIRKANARAVARRPKKT